MSKLEATIKKFKAAGFNLVTVEGADKGDLFIFSGERPSIREISAILNQEAFLFSDDDDGIFLRIYDENY
jgi:hypothetical protein